MRLWFNVKTHELATEYDMIQLYAIKIVNMCRIKGADVIEDIISRNAYTFDNFLLECVTPGCGMFVEVCNPEIAFDIKARYQ